MTTTVLPMKYHSPGWELSSSEIEFFVWGPNQDRDHWAACWQELEGNDGNYLQGADLDEVLTIFPDSISAEFRRAVG